MSSHEYRVSARSTALSIFLTIAVASSVFAQDVIDFEFLPDGGTPTDGMVIHDQFLADYGVSFELLELNGDPVDPTVGPTLAGVGAPKTAFVGFPSRNTSCDDFAGSTTDDVTLLPGRTGCFLLTDDNVHPGPRPFSLRIAYSTPVLQAGAELLDVDDGPESWRIEALDENGQLIVHPDNPIEIVYPTTPGTGDGTIYQWTFDFTDSGQGIHFINLIYTGNDDFGRGLAFDNFSPATLPTSDADDTPSSSLVLYPGAPNPFNAMTTVSFRLVRESAVTLTIYGLDGRRVRTLMNEVKGPGLWSAHWDGKNSDGRIVASGVYTCVLEGLGQSVKTRLTLVK